jgi:hypothetical protein
VMDSCRVCSVRNKGPANKGLGDETMMLESWRLVSSSAQLCARLCPTLWVQRSRKQRSHDAIQLKQPCNNSYQLCQRHWHFCDRLPCGNPDAATTATPHATTGPARSCTTRLRVTCNTLRSWRTPCPLAAAALRSSFLRGPHRPRRLRRASTGCAAPRLRPTCVCSWPPCD